MNNDYHLSVSVEFSTPSKDIADKLNDALLDILLAALEKQDVFSRVKVEGLQTKITQTNFDFGRERI